MLKKKKRKKNQINNTKKQTKPKNFNNNEIAIASNIKNLQTGLDTEYAYIEALLDQVQTKWQIGDLESLSNLDIEMIQYHPDKGKLALLAGVANLQVGNEIEGRKLIRLANEWEVDKNLIARFLIAGVHNSIGRAWVFNNNKERALEHFKTFITLTNQNKNIHFLSEAWINKINNNLQISLEPLNKCPIEEQFIKNYFSSKHLSANRIINSELYKVISELHNVLSPSLYLEICVEQGYTLKLAKCEAIGVYSILHSFSLEPHIKVISADADDFLTNLAEQWLKVRPDIVFLNTIPLIERVVKSLFSLEKCLKPASLVVIPGILPPSAINSTRIRTGDIWYGDVWKLPNILKTLRQDLQILTVNIDPAGLLFITNFNPDFDKNFQLSSFLDEQMLKDIMPPQSVIDREGSVKFKSSSWEKFLKNILKIERKK